MERQLTEALEQVLADLMAARDPRGHWEGELCSSALSTAVAVSALAHAGQAGSESGAADWNLVAAGLDWLAANQNEDGGFGDTIRSKSNLSTSILCLCAWRLTRTASSWGSLGTSSQPTSPASAQVVRMGTEKVRSVP